MNIANKITRILDYLKRPEKTSHHAKERLQIIIAHERGERDKPDYLPALQKELLEVITKYVKVNNDDVKIELDRQDGCSILELNIILPASE